MAGRLKAGLSSGWTPTISATRIASPAKTVCVARPSLDAVGTRAAPIGSQRQIPAVSGVDSRTNATSRARTRALSMRVDWPNRVVSCSSLRRFFDRRRGGSRPGAGPSIGRNSRPFASRSTSFVLPRSSDFLRTVSQSGCEWCLVETVRREEVGTEPTAVAFTRDLAKLWRHGRRYSRGPPRINRPASRLRLLYRFWRARSFRGAEPMPVVGRPNPPPFVINLARA